MDEYYLQGRARYFNKLNCFANVHVEKNISIQVAVFK